MEKPTTTHWAAIKQILRYIQGTLNYGCCYVRGGEGRLLGYSDSDHVGDTGDRKSTSGNVFFLGENPTSWTSQKQKVVAISSCEAEYVEATAATCQGLWLNRRISEMRGQEPTKFKLLINNKSAIALAKNPVHHDRNKHIDVKYHFIRECIEEGQVEVDHVRTNYQLADVLTKALGRVRFVEMRQKLGVREIGDKA
ncbi:secreted RxLR effector protein 161-like [Aegilops tauschii subsp. strangulata]|uniref:secreted RxLR effector protein 161-like n=1 Tax=Aegilops tauschii subsp. strangulata TaxID=200361 RepID=UPI001ABCE8AE|nr:secreted RxLR effector protein 161-like [Aegilops tauschii subsp. strangulata]